MKKVKEVMYAKEDIVAVNEDDPARLAVLEASEYKVFNIPVINDDDVVVGVVRTFDIVKTLSSLYEIKVYKIFEAMEEELKGVTWEELMEASAIVTRRRTGKRVTAQDYEKKDQGIHFRGSHMGYWRIREVLRWTDCHWRASYSQKSGSGTEIIPLFPILFFTLFFH